MNRERAETYLRLLAEAELRDPALALSSAGPPARSADAPFVTAPVALTRAAWALTAVGALDLRTAEGILADAELAVAARHRPDVTAASPAGPRLGPRRFAGGRALSAPLANRLCHLYWQAHPRSVADGLAGGWAAPQVPLLPDGWQGEEISSLGLVAAFLHVRPALACAPPTDAASAGRGWPSPRTWEMAGRLMAAAGAAGASDEARSALIRGAVGDGAGVEFLAWLIEMDLPDPEQVLADPGSFRLPERGDRAYAALASIAAAVASNPTPERWAAGWQVLGLAADEALDMAAAAARVLARCRPAEVKELPEEVHIFIPVLRAAGLFNG